MTARHCTHCGGTVLRLGLIEDTGQQAHGESRWLEGPFEHGFFGGKRHSRKTARTVDAYRCTVCDHLELFVGPEG
ncbi:hypothetical protein ASD42_14500 [Nocardia sp. Root136]|uniref:hypothetical protein n=1 Tax=Nocardia sp. Root136 TaxID=1736458 RepID=UPI0006FA93FE|nr:hypothetical protein [Nocardia sp. Root136]KQY33113.1 hypothetical protein ASD42_14500 [Nocardia sp. Root136]